MIYLDNAATTKPDKAVIDAMIDNMENSFGNPSSIHSFGLMAERAVNKAREGISALIGAKPEEIYFTGGGTESNNLALIGSALATKSNRKTIITSKLEHKAVLRPLEYLEEMGFIVKYVKNDKYGNMDMDHMNSLIDDDVCLVSIMHVNNEIGIINDIYGIGNIIKSKKSNALFHVDGIQSFSKLHIDVRAMGIDMLSISAHKAHGAKGVGVLYIKSGIKIKPLIYGGGQEKGLRSGTENLPGIIGFDAICRNITKSKIEESYRNAEKQQERLIEIICDRVEFAKPISCSEMNSKSPYITSIAFNGILAEVLIHLLEMKDIYISTGSACNAKKKEYSHVLNALGLDERDKMGTVRISISSTTTWDEIESGAEIIANSALELSKTMRRNR